MPTKEHEEKSSKDHDKEHEHEHKHEPPGRITHPRPSHGVGKSGVNPRLTKSVEEMTAFCPNLPCAPDPSGLGASWTGNIAPLTSVEHLPELLDDICHHRPVFTVANARLRHLPDCTASHCQHDWMNSIRLAELSREFNIRILYSGTHEDPRCWIQGIDGTNGRHMWSDGSI